MLSGFDLDSITVFDALAMLKEQSDDSAKLFIYLLENLEIFSIAKYRYDFVEFVEENMIDRLNDVCAYLDGLDVFTANFSMIDLDYSIVHEFSVMDQITLIDQINSHAWGRAPRRPLRFNFVFRIF